MIINNIVTTTARLALLIFCLSTVMQPLNIQGQDGDSVPQMEKKVSELIKRQKYTEALPILEKLAAADPNNPKTHFELGFALIAEAANTKDLAIRKATRVRARNEFLKSKELGNNEPLVDAMIQGLPLDGSEPTFTENKLANKIMEEAEASFSKGNLDDALKKYQRALQLEPKLYEAALFSGDVYTQRGDFKEAEFWYQSAIVIDPNRETAYRYSATPLMKQNKYDQALDRYIEAFITEPYSRFSVAGLSQWAQTTGKPLAHPTIDIPTSVTIDEKGDVKINLDASLLMSGKDDGSFAWLSYGGTRRTWHQETFAKTFPQEKSYRHSLMEEADAIRSVLTIATSDKKVKSLSPALAKLKKLNDEGLLESYILLARADKGIAQDHPAYLAQNRNKLRRYVVEYVVTAGGK